MSPRPVSSPGFRAPSSLLALVLAAAACSSAPSPGDTAPASAPDDRAGAREDLDRVTPLPETSAPQEAPQTVGLDGEAAGSGGQEACEGLSAATEVWVPEAGDLVLRDRETGSLWNVNGQAFEGPCRGAQLTQLPSFVVFWFSWSATRHGGEIWNLEALNLPGPIEPDPSGRCEVPCNEIRSGGPPPDGIPQLDHLGRWDRPKPAGMIPASEASYLAPTDLVNGVAIDGEARAYPHSIMIWHEIHTDRIGDTEYNVTFCPLTGSALLLPADQGGGEPMYFYVSGTLFNDNLTMFERGVPIGEATFWNQMLRKGIDGPRRGEGIEIGPLVETTWERWVQMHPDTLVTDPDTGYTRNYGRNPYDDRPDANTLMPVNPQWEPFYRNKDRVLALDGAEAQRAYPFPEMAAHGERVVVNDVFEEEPLVVVYEQAHRMAIPYSRRLGESTLTFEAELAP